MWQGVFPDSIDSALDEMERTIQETHPAADVYVFPELYLGGYYLQELRIATASHLERVQALSAQHDVAIVFGFVEKAASADDDDDKDGKAFCYYNSALCVDHGQPVAPVYRKTHLFGAQEKAAFVPGHTLGEPFVLRGVLTALLICYDLEFPEAARTLTMHDGGAQLLLVPTANMAPYDIVNDYIVPARALENHCTVAYVNWADKFTSTEGVTFNGRSSLVGPTGRPLLKFDDPAEQGESSSSVVVKVAEIEFGSSLQTEDDYKRDLRPELYKSALKTAKYDITLEHRVGC